ncbi:unnamed protein product, partial [Allacma fusca]
TFHYHNPCVCILSTGTALQGGFHLGIFYLSGRCVYCNWSFDYRRGS